MDRLFESPDFEGIPPLSMEVVDEALHRGDITAAELLMLYFACATAEPEDTGEMSDAAERIADYLLDLAEDEDEEAAMALMALNTLLSDDNSEPALIVGAEMFRSVTMRSVLRSVIAGRMETEDAAAAIMVINSLTAHHLGVDPDDVDDVDLDELAAMLGVSDLDWDDDIDDR